MNEVSAMPRRPAADRSPLARWSPTGIVALVVLAGLFPSSGALAQLRGKGLPPGVPGFSKTFLPDTIGPGSVSTLEFTIDQSFNVAPATSLAFTDTLPAGVTIATPAGAASTCGGTLSAPDGGSTITFTDGTVAGSSTCRIAVNVTSATVGTHMNVSGNLSSDAGSSGSAFADLTVATDRPGFSKSFSPGTVSLGGRSTLTLTIDNSANSSLVFSLAVTDNLPIGIEIAGPANASTTCTGGTLVATPGTRLLSYSLGQVAAMSTCTIQVDVVGVGVGTLVNTTGELFSSTGGPSVSSGKATAALTVNAPADPITLLKSFTDDPAIPGGTVTLEFTLINRDRSDAATNVAFTDDLNATLSGLVSTSGTISNPCGAGSQISGTSLLTFTGGNLAAGASCTFSVTLQVPAGAAPGGYTNATSAVTGDVGGAMVAGSPAVDILYVDTAPQLTKTFLTDPVGGGDVVGLEFTITNTSSTATATNIAFTDNLDAFISGVAVTMLPAAGFCGAGSTATQVILGANLILRVDGANLAASGSCTFTVDLQLPIGAPAGTFTNTTSNVTATVGGNPSIGPPASDTLSVVGAPLLRKSFTDDPVLPGGTVTLELTLSHDASAPGDATGIGFTDDLTFLSNLMSLSGTQTDVCGTGSQISGTTNLSFTGGTLAPGASCTFSVSLQVDAGALPGTYLNTTSDVEATVLGVATTRGPAQDSLVVTGLTLTKAFTDDPVIPGGTVTLQFTLDNTSSVLDVTNISFNDNLSASLAGLAAVGLPAMNVCGTGSQITGTTSLVFTGGNLLAGSSCTFTVTLQVPGAAADGLYLNTTTALIATIGGTPTTLDPASDALEVTTNVLLLTKTFTDDPVAPGGTVTLQFTLDNTGSQTVDGITFTDDLDAALSGLSSTSGTISNPCGAGSQLAGTSVLTLTGGTLAAGTSCTFSVTLQVPLGVALGAVATNTTSAASGNAGGVPVTGGPASDTLQINSLGFTKSFSGPTTAGATPTLSFTIQNLGATPVGAVSFFDDLGAVLPGLVATGLPAGGVCGAGSQLTGTSTVQLTGGTLAAAGAAGDSCTFAVTLQVPAAAAAGSYPNTTSDLLLAGLQAGSPATDTLVVEPPPAFSKSFTPPTINFGGTSTLRLTIDNTASSLAATSLAVTDNLPAGVVVATPPNASTTCTGGSVTATAGTAVLGYAGGSVSAGASCTLQVDVTSSSSGAHVNTTGALTSSSGNSGTAGATLTVRSAGPLFSKAFVPAAIAAGGTSTLVFTIDNSTGTTAATNLDFTDNLPAGITVVNPPAPITTCTGGAITATNGSGVLAYTGGSVNAGGTCQVQVVVTGTTPGAYVNTSGNLTSSLGSSGTATATLTIEPPPTFSKSFAPTTIAPGDVTALVFTVDNTASSLPAANLSFSDTLPASISVAAPPNASTTCAGGTITAVAGANVVGYTGGSVPAGALCTVQVDVTATTAGNHVNTTDDLLSSLGTSPPATATLVVGAPGPLAIPTADRWALAALALLLLGVAVLRLRLAG